MQIIGDTPEITSDLKSTIDYLENIVINSQTLPKLNCGELVLNINKLIQSVEVLSIYKKQLFNLVDIYNAAREKLSDPFATFQEKTKAQQRVEVIEEILKGTNMPERKNYWIPFS